MGSNTSYVTNTHVNGYATGIEILTGAQANFFSNVRVDAWYQAVTFNLEGGGEQAYGVFFSNCTFGIVNGAIALGNQTSGVLITTPGEASQLASIVFDNCTSYGWANAGIEIDAGQNIVITGGQYSSNGQNPTSPSLGAGIAITDALAPVSASEVTTRVSIAPVFTSNGRRLDLQPLRLNRVA